MRDLCHVVNLSPGNKDTFVYNLDPKVFFGWIPKHDSKVEHIGIPIQKKLWKIKIPAKVKKVMWLAIRKSILTKYVLHRRGREGD
jgi:hypothetical protein